MSTGDCDLFLDPLECARAVTGELTKGCYGGGGSQGLSGCSNLRILEIPTISFQ